MAIRLFIFLIFITPFPAFADRGKTGDAVAEHPRIASDQSRPVPHRKALRVQVNDCTDGSCDCTDPTICEPQVLTVGEPSDGGGPRPCVRNYYCQPEYPWKCKSIGSGCRYEVDHPQACESCPG